MRASAIPKHVSDKRGAELRLRDGLEGSHKCLLGIDCAKHWDKCHRYRVGKLDTVLAPWSLVWRTVVKYRI